MGILNRMNWPLGKKKYGIQNVFDSITKFLLSTKEIMDNTFIKEHNEYVDRIDYCI